MTAASRVEPPPRTALEALERAHTHARAAIVELLRAALALVDAASLGWSGKPGEAHAALRTIARNVDDVIKRLEDEEAGVPAPAMRAILRALDDEIARWEKRSAQDTEARAVLRTFLGLREILWEFTMRPEAEKPSTASGPTAPEARATPSDEAATRPGSRRVQRVEVQG